MRCRPASGRLQGHWWSALLLHLCSEASCGVISLPRADKPMAIRDWHPGKLVLVWLVCGLPAWLLFKDGARPRPETSLRPYLLPNWLPDEEKRARLAEWRYADQMVKLEVI